MTDADRLRDAQAAFDRGDFAEVRAITDGLRTSLDADLRKKALALRARVSVDPIAVVVIVVCMLFFAGVVVNYYGAR